MTDVDERDLRSAFEELKAPPSTAELSTPRRRSSGRARRRRSCRLPQPRAQPLQGSMCRHLRGPLAHAEHAGDLSEAQSSSDAQADKLTVAPAQRLDGGADRRQRAALLRALLDGGRGAAVAAAARQQGVAAALTAVLVDHRVAR